jgi:hypothetical protein
VVRNSPKIERSVERILKKCGSAISPKAALSLSKYPRDFNELADLDGTLAA